MSNLKMFVGIMFITALLLFAGCVTKTTQTPNENVPAYNQQDISSPTSVPTTGQTPATQDMKKFSSLEELQAWLAANAQAATQTNYGGMAREVAAGIAPSAAPMALDAAMEKTSAGSSSGYSTTNVQVEGVDEADFVKNDANYIYIVSGSNLVIVDAKTMKTLSTTKVEQPKEMFVNGDKLILFASSYNKSYYVEKYDIEPREYYQQLTVARIYDINDKSNPKEISNVTMTGNLFQSRMIGDKVYAVTQEGVNYGPMPYAPMVKSAGKSISPSIYYFDNPDSNYQFNTITSIDMSSNAVIDSKTFMLGYSNTLMMSENNIYIAYQKSNYWPCRFCYYNNNQYDKERFYNVIQPRLKGELKTSVDAITAKNLNESEQWKQISEVFASYYNKMLDNNTMKAENKAMFDDITDALDAYDSKKAIEQSKTIIHRMNVKDGVITYVGKGEVAGTLLNQFSMDESNGNLRVATTISIWTSKQIQYNNVFVLNSEMKTIGSIEKIAPDERIYSARFMGDKLYLVTFRQTDPFFVIDLSKPTNPKVVGKLKLPGFSSYLHPYNENYIIGVGKETSEDSYGGVKTQGVKVALFDVRDIENPKLVDSMLLGSEYSDSAALRDHRAFLFSKEKNLLVLPVTDHPDGYNWNSNRQPDVWNGAYALKVDEKGFRKIGTVEHFSGRSTWYWGGEGEVQRSLYIGNTLFTVSTTTIIGSDLANDLKEVGEVSLPRDDNNPPYYYYK